MNKIIVLILVFLVIWSYNEIFLRNDPNRDIAYSILRKKEYENSDFIIKRNTPPQIQYEFIEDDFIKTKKEIISENYKSTDIEARISKFDKKEQSLLYALLATICIRNNNLQDFNKFIIKSYMIMLKLPIVERGLFSYEIIRTLASTNSQLSQEYAVIFLLQQIRSQDKFIHLYLLLQRKYSRKKLLTLLKSEEFKNKNELISSIVTKSKIDINKLSDKNLEKLYLYTFSQFSMPWSIKKWTNYNYPFLAYLCYLNGDINRYDKYKKKSLSQEQLEIMKGGYFEYIEYASKIFCMTNDIDSALYLVKTLPEGNKKNIVLKHLASYLSLTKEYTTKTLNSDIFKPSSFLERMNLN